VTARLLRVWLDLAEQKVASVGGDASVGPVAFFEEVCGGTRR